MQDYINVLNLHHTAKMGNHIFSAVSRPALEPTQVRSYRKITENNPPLRCRRVKLTIQRRGQECVKLYIHSPYVFILLFMTKHWKKLFFL